MVADNYDVRSWRKNGQHLLTVSLSDSDPKRTWRFLLYETHVDLGPLPDFYRANYRGQG